MLKTVVSRKYNLEPLPKNINPLIRDFALTSINGEQ